MSFLRSTILAVITAIFVAGTIKAQESFLPLVQQDTVSITCCNLSKIDSDRASQNIESMLNVAVDYFVAEEAKAKEIKQSLPIFTVMFSQYFSMFVQPLKDANVEEFYIVVDQPQNPDEANYPYMAIPTVNMTKEEIVNVREQLTEINKQLDSSIKYRFERNGFLVVVFIPSEVDEKEAKSYVKEHFSKFNTVPKAEFSEGFQQIDSNAFLYGVNLAVDNEAQVRKQMQCLETTLSGLVSTEEANTTLIQEILEKYSELSKKILPLCKYEYWSVSFETPYVISKVQTISDEAAEQYVELVNNDIKSALQWLFESVSKKVIETTPEDQESIEQIVQLLNEFCDTFITPQANGSSVNLLTINQDFWDKNKPFFDKVGAFVTEYSKKLQSQIEEQEEQDEE